MSPQDPRATLFSVAADGTRTPFPRSGVRIRVEPEVWAQVDFDFARSPWSIQIGVRRRGAAPSRLPPLSITPRAGNVFIATIGEGMSPPSELQVVPVDKYPFTADDFLHVLAKFKSGDFDGEHALSQPTVETIETRELVVQYDDFASVHVRLSLPKTAQLAIEVHAAYAEPDDPTASFRVLQMWLSLNASNLVTCLFQESTAVSPSTARKRGGET